MKNELVTYHVSDEVLSKDQIKPYLHTGSIEQGLMRRPSGVIHRIYLRQTYKIVIMKDRGSWTHGQLKSASRRGDVAQYLNRYEGVSLEDNELATKHSEASDAVFRKNVKSAKDSWIILNPEVIARVEVVSGP